MVNKKLTSKASHEIKSSYRPDNFLPCANVSASTLE